MLYTSGLAQLIEDGASSFTVLLSDIAYRPSPSDTLRDIQQARGLGYTPKDTPHRVIRSPVGVALQLDPVTWAYSSITSNAAIICLGDVPLVYVPFGSIHTSFGGDFTVEFSPLMLT